VSDLRRYDVGLDVANLLTFIAGYDYLLEFEESRLASERLTATVADASGRGLINEAEASILVGPHGAALAVLMKSCPGCGGPTDRNNHRPDRWVTPCPRHS
jgi:hypothetical protein